MVSVSRASTIGRQAGRRRAAWSASVSTRGGAKRRKAKHCRCSPTTCLGQYRFATLVTDLDLPVPEIWRSDRGRADGENRITELKYTFAAGSFCPKDFSATEACL